MNISKDTLSFLEKLHKNNNRDWFNAHKKEFTTHQDEVKSFYKAIENELNKSDQIESHKIYRIYRDVRFSNDKSPFKARFAGNFSRATAALRGGYFLNIEPGNSIAGGGFYSPNPDDLKRIRQEFELDDTEIRAILTNKKFKAMFGSLQGEEVKSAPRGFDPQHPAIDLIKKKQFYVFRKFSDKEVCAPNFMHEVMETFHTIRPYFDYMSAVLTTDSNGESII